MFSDFPNFKRHLIYSTEENNENENKNKQYNNRTETTYNKDPHPRKLLVPQETTVSKVLKS